MWKVTIAKSGIRIVQHFDRKSDADDWIDRAAANGFPDIGMELTEGAGRMAAQGILHTECETR